MENIVIQLEDQSLINWDLLNPEQIQSILEREFNEDPLQLKIISELLKHKINPTHLDEIFQINWIYPVFVEKDDFEYKSKLSKLNYKTNSVILPTIIYLEGFEINPKKNKKITGSNVVRFNNNIIYNSYGQMYENIEYINLYNPKLKRSLFLYTTEEIYTYYNLLYHSIAHPYNYKIIEKKIIKEYELINDQLLIQQANNKIYNQFDKSLEEIYGTWNLKDTLTDNYLGFILYLGNFKINYYAKRLDQLKKYFELIYKVNEKIKQHLYQLKLKEIQKNYYNYAVYTQLGSTIFIKYIEGIPLTLKQKELVEKYLIIMSEQTQRYITNNCGHIPIRNSYNSEQTLKTKKELMHKLITEFGKNGIDPETHFIFCSTCGFNIGCEHETIEDQDKLEQYEILNGVSIECKYCQRIISTDSIVYEPEYDENNRKITGIVIDTNNDLMYLQGIINNMLRYFKLSGRIRMTTVLDFTYSILTTKYLEIENKEFIQIQSDLIKKIITIGYIYGYLVNQENYDIKMFKNIDNKEKRKIIYNLLEQNDPKFIKDLLQTNNLKLFINTLAKAEKYFENNIVRNVNKLANKLYGYKFKFNIVPDDLSKKQLINLNNKFKLFMYNFIPFQRLEVKKYELIKIINNILKKVEDYTQFNKEMHNLLNIICFNRRDKIKYNEIQIDCQSIDTKIINKIREEYEKPHKSKKLEEVSIQKLKIKKFPENKLDNNLLKYFGDKYIILEEFYNHINKLIYLEQYNIIKKLIRYYRQIHFKLLPNEIDNKFIEKYNHSDFKLNLIFEEYKPISYYISKIALNENVVKFIIEFIDQINYSLSIAEYTEENIESIENKIREEIRKNYELYGKLTPDEKLNYQFSKNFADKFSQVAEIRKQKEEELQNEFDQEFKEDIPFEQSYDDIREYDDDDIYLHDEGEVEYFGKEDGDIEF